MEEHAFFAQALVLGSQSWVPFRVPEELLTILMLSLPDELKQNLRSMGLEIPVF